MSEEKFFCKRCNFKSNEKTEICAECNEFTQWADKELSETELLEEKEKLLKNELNEFEIGVNKIKEDKLDEAEIHFMKVSKSNEKYNLAQKYINEISIKRESNKSIKNDDFFSEANELMNKGELEKALEIFKKIGYEDKNYYKAQEYISKLEEINLYNKVVDISYEDLTRDINSKKGEIFRVSGKIRDIQDNNNSSIVVIDAYDSSTKNETGSIVLKCDEKTKYKINDSIYITAMVEGEFEKMRNSLANWFGRSYRIYVNGNAKEDRIPLMRLIEVEW